jgi:hypothetical protein
VRDRVGGQVREVAEREGVERLVARLLADLEPDVPGVAMAPAAAYFFAMLVSAAIDP